MRFKATAEACGLRMEYDPHIGCSIMVGHGVSPPYAVRPTHRLFDHFSGRPVRAAHEVNILCGDCLLKMELSE